jgi:hypothetical protein
MRCAEVEVLLCDYLDGALRPDDRELVDRHLKSCEACAELARDAAAAVQFMDRAAVVEPPPELMTRLLFDAPWKQVSKRPGAGLWARLHGLIQPVLQPRLVMGMALTILSFSMLGRFVLPGRQIQAADLDPVKVWTALDNRVHRLWERTVKSYESIRFVYQIQSRLREWQEQRDAAETAATTEAEASEAPPDPRRLPVDPPPQDQQQKTGNTR